jgi:flagellar biosynthesis protein FlhB
VSDEDHDSKTQEPTEKRRREARERGEVARSKDLSTAATILAFGGFLMASGYAFYAAMATMLRSGIGMSYHVTRIDALTDHIVDILLALAVPLLVFSVLLMFIAVGSQILTGGFVFSMSMVAPKFSRIDPFAGFARMFGRHGALELGKSLLKAVLFLAGSSWFVFHNSPAILALISTDVEQAKTQVISLIITLVFFLGGLSLLVSAADVVSVLVRIKNRLMMTQEEVKEEYKQNEGSPEAKQHRRSRQKEIIKSSFRSTLQDADVIVTNPVHFAVALRYTRGKDAAPVVLAKGRDLMAEALKDIGNEIKVPVLESPVLARALYFTGKAGAEVDYDLYHAVAAVLSYVFRARENKYYAAMPLPEVDVPDQLRFDANGVCLKQG